MKDLDTKLYDKWLRELGMFSLLKRGIRGDMITAFQYLRGYHKEEKID